MITKANSVKMKGKDGKSELRRLRFYVDDPDKVLRDDYAFNTEDFRLAGDFTYDISEKTDGVRVRLVGGYRCEVDDFPDRVMELRDLYMYYRHLNKDDGPIAYHIVLSWPPGVRVSDEDVYRIGCLLLQALGDYPGIIGAHIEPTWDDKHECWTGEQKHAHIVVCAYPDSFEKIPRKLRLGRGNSKIRELADQLAIEYKQGIVADPDNARAHSYPIAKNFGSWLRPMRDAAEAAAEAADSMETYVQLLAEKGYIIHQEEEQLLYQRGEDFAPDYALGRSLTRKGLLARWIGEMSSEVLECPIDELETKEKELFVDISLGGNPKRTNSFYHFSLQEGAADYSEDTLRSYFPSYMSYYVTDGEQKVRCEVTGNQILDYFGVGVDGDAVKGVDYEIAMKRIERAQERVRRQIERRCESQLWAQDRELARALRRQELGGGSRWVHPGEHTVVYYNRNPDGTKKCFSEKILLMLCYYTIPDFPLEDYCQWEIVRPKERSKDGTAVFGPADPRLQAGMDAMRIAREEGVENYWDLYSSLREAESRYEEVAEQLAEVNGKLLRNRDLYDDLIRCRKARYQLRRLQRGECEDLSEEEREAIVSEYEEAVSKVKDHIGGHWTDWERVINNYRHLLDIKVGLQQAVYAEYERKERLRFVEQQRRIEGCRTRIEAELDERRRALPKPSLNLIIQAAEEKCDKQALARGKAKRKNWEIKSK